MSEVYTHILIYKYIDIKMFLSFLAFLEMLPFWDPTNAKEINNNILKCIHVFSSRRFPFLYIERKLIYQRCFRSETGF